MKVTYYGHSAFGVDFGGKKLLFDPFISPNDKANHIDIDKIEADYILVSHGHGDHVADVESIAKRTGAKIISSFEIVSWFEDKDLEGHPLNVGGKWSFDFGTVKYVYGAHSSILPDGSYGGPSGAFVLWNDENCFYFAGDTALTMDLKLIPVTCPTLDFAILPIGDNFTMGYEDAAIAADFIECSRIIGCHFDTFGYIEIDHDAAKNHFASKDKELLLMKIGGSIDI